jgi:MFS family permease
LIHTHLNVTSSSDGSNELSPAHHANNRPFLQHRRQRPTSMDVSSIWSNLGKFTLASGRMGDIFGHKNRVITGFSWMALWSIAGGLSAYSNYVLFLFARAFRRMGSALMQPNGLALLRRTCVPGSKKRNMTFTLFGAMVLVRCLPWSGIRCTPRSASVMAMDVLVASIVCVFLVLLASFVLPRHHRHQWAIVSGKFAGLGLAWSILWHCDSSLH